MTQKTCPKCGAVKPTELFNRRAKATDGLTHWCKECCNRSRAEYRNSDKGKKAIEDWKESKKEKYLASIKEWKKRNSEEVKAYDRERSKVRYYAMKAAKVCPNAAGH